MTMEGTYDADTHTVTMYGKGTDMSGKPYESKSTTKYTSDDERVFTYARSSQTRPRESL